MLKLLDIDLLCIVEHHVPMDETEKMATTVKNCHSLLIPGYGVMSKHRHSSSGGVGWYYKETLNVESWDPPALPDELLESSRERC